MLAFDATGNSAPKASPGDFQREAPWVMHRTSPGGIMSVASIDPLCEAEERRIVVETRDNAAIVRDLFDAFNSHDLDRAATMVTEDFELVDLAARGQTFRGPEGLREWFQTFLTALPDARTELINVVAADEWAFSEHIGRGTHTGPLVGPAGELPPTGRTVELRIGEVYRIEDGKIALAHAYYDGATMMRQLGVFPPRPEVLVRILIHQANKLRSRLRARR
jgi:steroid delta-isomerase-like uncharacterized protein